MSEDRLNDKEWAEVQRNHGLLQGAIAKHGKETIKQALKDAIQFPAKKGDLKK